MRIKRKMLEGTLEVLKASQTERAPYYVRVFGRQFLVRPGIFSPKYFEDTEFFVREVKVRPNESFLEIGSGCGAVCITKSLEGARPVVAVDINPIAVETTRDNASAYLTAGSVTVYEGNLFGPLPKGQRFDTIFWNVPFACIDDTPTLSLLERSVIDPFYFHLCQYIKESRSYLNPGGRLLIGFSNTLGYVKWLRKLLVQYGFRYKIVARTNAMETNPVTFELYEARLE